MKQFRVVIIFLVFSLFWMISCTKESQEELVFDQALDQRSITLPTVINDMLHFDSYADFEEFVSDLTLEEQDTNAVKTAYATLGINLAADSIPNLTDHPICLITEQNISGFNSARKVEETVINNALYNGEDVFSLIEDPYLKSALNEDYSVHVGTRIFTYFDNGGIIIVMDNDWNTYNSIFSKTFDEIHSQSKVFVSSQSKSNWELIYNYDQNGNVLSEKGYTVEDSISAVPQYCDFSDLMIVTDLKNGKLRVELQLDQVFDIYEWTFEDGSKEYAYPLIIDCDERNSGYVELDVWMNCPQCPNGKRRVCRGTVFFECDCGEQRTRKDQLIRTVNGQTWKIDASIWVKSGNVGCSMKYLRKRFGIWMPWTNKGVCTDINGTYKRENTDKSCSDIWYTDIKCLGNGTWPTSISVSKNDVPKIYREPDELDSGHKVNVKGDWFGFGVDGVPRLVLD